MSKKISKRRLEMGDEAWQEYQKERKRLKCESYGCSLSPLTQPMGCVS
jgi:hypothetical protein